MHQKLATQRRLAKQKPFWWLGEQISVPETVEVLARAFEDHCRSVVPAVALGPGYNHALSPTLALQWVWGTTSGYLVSRLVCPILLENV